MCFYLSRRDKLCSRVSAVVKTVFFFLVNNNFKIPPPPKSRDSRMPRFGDLCENSNSQVEHTVQVPFGKYPFFGSEKYVHEFLILYPYPDGPLLYPIPTHLSAIVNKKLFFLYALQIYWCPEGKKSAQKTLVPNAGRA
jgi:hypothetical protein